MADLRRAERRAVLGKLRERQRITGMCRVDLPLESSDSRRVKGGAKLDHFGGVKLDQLEMDPRVCFEFLWDGWNVA